MSGQDLNDFSMLELFRLEAVNQTQVLSDGLVEFEENPGGPEKMEPLMRAAHSLKGAASIVQLSVIVKLAHSMEDCFVAAMKGVISFGAAEFDLLLEGVDLIRDFAKSPEADADAFLAANSERFSFLTSAYSYIKEGKTPEGNHPAAAAPVPAAPVPEKKEPVPEVEQKITTDTDKYSFHSVENPEKKSVLKDNFVRVAAEKLNRLLGLAGELVVDVKNLQKFEKKVIDLKKTFITLAEASDSLHEAFMLKKIGSGGKELVAQLRENIAGFYGEINDFFSEFSNFTIGMDNFSHKLYEEALSCKIRPFDDVAASFPRTARDAARALGKKVRIEIDGKKTAVDRDILENLEAPLMHIIRNAVDHGIETPEERVKTGKDETGLLKISAFHWAGVLNITIEDDGRGIDTDALKKRITEKGLATEAMIKEMTDQEILNFLFLPGFSTASSVTEISGRGVGLDVVLNMVQEVRGRVEIETSRGKGTTFHLQLPITLSVMPALLADVGGEPYALPLSRVDKALIVSGNEILSAENHQFIVYNGSNVGIVSARELFEYPAENPDSGEFCVAIISDRFNQYALIVDRFIGERKIVVRPIDERLGKLPCFSSASVIEDGSPLLVIDVDDMVRSIDSMLKTGSLHNLQKDKFSHPSSKKKKILVVDDSITVRELERNLLTNSGYIVETAVDGIDGWNAVRTGGYDVIITDVDMPRMNGFQLLEKIKEHEKFKDIPVMIVSYKDREEDRIKGIDLGASYYLTKGSFHDNTMIDAVYNLVGDPE